MKSFARPWTLLCLIRTVTSWAIWYSSDPVFQLKRRSLLRGFTNMLKVPQQQNKCTQGLNGTPPLLGSR